MSSVPELAPVGVGVTRTTVSRPVGCEECSDERLTEESDIWLEFSSMAVLKGEAEDEEDADVIVEAKVFEVLEAGEFSDNWLEM